MNKTETLITGLEQIGIEYNKIQLDKLELYISEIELWNKKYKLVGADGETLIIRHVLDSLSSVPELKKLKFMTAADVGSGAGLPGIPLSIFFPDVHFTLIERSGRRAGFLRNVLGLLNVTESVSILESDLDEVKTKYDLVLFRAFRNLVDFYESLIKIKTSDGCLFAYKGKIDIIESEISKLKNKNRVDIIKAYVPFLEAERNFCILY